ncbi:reverse transcriptase, partial [Tanacetum coccineum]
VTLKKMGIILYWRGMKKLTKTFVAEYDACQRNKSDLAASPSYLQPLLIPNKVWHDISIDFIEALPPFKGKTVLFVVVDRLSKYAYFIPMSHPFTASQVAQVQLNLSTAYHPQTNGQTDVVNKCVKCFMRCMTGEKPKEWVKWVSLAEYWYNTNFHSFAHTTPFEIVYGQPPNLHLPYIAGTSSIEEVDRTMQAREQPISMLQFHLKRSQERMKNMDDKNRSGGDFEVGMKLKLCKGTNHQVGILPECGPDGALSVEPEAIIEKRLGKLHNKAVLYVLVKWINQAEEDATWELYTDLIIRFPQMELHS